MATNSQQVLGQEISGLLTIIPNEHRGVQSNTLAQHCVCLCVCCSMGLHYNLPIRISITDLLAHWQLLYTLNAFTFPFSHQFLFLHPLSFIYPSFFSLQGSLNSSSVSFLHNHSPILPSLFSIYDTLSFIPSCIPPIIPLLPSFSSLHPSFFLSPNSLLTLPISVCLPPSLPPHPTPPHPQPSSFIHPESLALTLGRGIPLHMPFFLISLGLQTFISHYIISFFSPLLFFPNPRHPEPWAYSACYYGCRARCQHMGGWCKMGTECFEVVVPCSSVFFAVPLPPDISGSWGDNFSLRFVSRF